MLRQAENILTDGKEGKCGLDGMWPLVPSACFTPGEMTGFGRPNMGAPTEGHRDSPAARAAAVAPMRCRGQRNGVPLTEVREASHGQYY
jgi:hypothetical protein